MFSTLSRPGIILENVRSLSFSLMASSLALPLLGTEAIAVAICIMIGGYYGYRLEKETHEFSSLGGRILRGGSWDYLVLASPGPQG
jgi:hypothetical protein